MAGWSIRRKLGLLVTIPLVVLLIGGGVLVTSLGLQYRQAHTARTYADAIEPTLLLGRALDNEFGDPSSTTNNAALLALRNTTDAQVRQARPYLKSLAAGNADTSNLPVQAQTVLTELEGLDNSRGLVNREISALAQNDANAAIAVSHVAASTTSLRQAVQTLIFGLTGELGVVSPNGDTNKDSTFVSSLSQVMQNAVFERALFNSVLSDQVTMNTDRFSELKRFQAAQTLALSQARTISNPQQTLRLSELTNQESTLGLWRNAMENRLNNPDASVGELSAWKRFSGDRLNAINTITNQAAEDTRSAAHSDENSAILRTGAVTVAVLLTLLVVTGLLAAIARTVTQPLRRLRAGAVEVASVQLPAAVARIEQDGIGADVSLPPVLPADALAGPETIEVARAVDDLGAEAVRLATAQVRLRRALDEAFVSMSRRSQSMVEKQLAIIDDLESQEQDPDQLRNLFRLDHLAARMRRYNDNLLVLAGSAVRTRATAPVKIAELFRAATSEMEQYERVRLQPVSGASIAGTVAGELVHLLAELLDNAAMYSPPSSAIVLSAAFTADGGLQIEVLDAGVGISPGELDRLNGRLSQPEAIDTQVPSRMGLFVVARLARRGTFGVMLQARPDASGTVALVRVPATLVIGAPGSTGEQSIVPPTALRPATPSLQLEPQSSQSQYAAYAPPAAQQLTPRSPAPAPGAPAPAATAAAAAAQAAAGVRSVTDENGPDGALPRRRRAATAAGAGPTAGLPPEAVAAASNPATGLFTPITPPAPVPEDAGERRPTGATAINRAPAPPPTSPTGIGGISGIAGMQSRGQQPSGQNPWDAPPFSSPNQQPGQPQQPMFERPSGPPAAPPNQPDRPNHSDHSGPVTPAAGITGLPGLAPPVRRGPSAPLPTRPGQSRPDTGQFPVPNGSRPAGHDPLSAPTGAFHTAPNQTVPSNGNGANGWDDDLPTELAARAAAAAAYRPNDPNLPMIGDDARPDFNDPTPIFDQISVWFTAEPESPAPAEAEGEQVIDLRGQEERRPSNRWASLGDQRWLATNARASAAPDVEATLETGLPKRRPGANLLPSAAAAVAPGAPRPSAGRPSPARPPAGRPAPAGLGASGNGGSGDRNQQDAAIVRGRLGSYQRGLANARRARSGAGPVDEGFDPVGASLFTANSEAGENAGRPSGEQGGDQ
jgi:signal transduction histidine kinase